MGIRAINTAWNRSGVNGTTTYSDGTKAYWNEGRSSETTYKHADGTTERHGVANDPTPYFMEMDQGEYGTQTEATREEEIEWEVQYGGISREQAEQNIAELDEQMRADEEDEFQNQREIERSWQR